MLSSVGIFLLLVRGLLSAEKMLSSRISSKLTTEGVSSFPLPPLLPARKFLPAHFAAMAKLSLGLVYWMLGNRES